MYISMNGIMINEDSDKPYSPSFLIDLELGRECAAHDCY